MSTPKRFIFAIPFRSKAASKDWDRNCALLSATLLSVLAQTDPGFDVLVACHEAPEIPELADPRIKLLRAETAPPTDFVAQMKDKGHKRKLMAVEARRRGGGYFMLTDSDDLVSRDLVRHARAAGSDNGYLIRDGYVYDAQTGSCGRTHVFDAACGTCAALAFAPDDLPDSIDDETPRLSSEYRMHSTFAEDAARLGRPLDIVPFPAAMYITGHGENHSVRSAGPPSLRRRLAPLIKRANRLAGRKRPPQELIGAFGFHEERYAA